MEPVAAIQVAERFVEYGLEVPVPAIAKHNSKSKGKPAKRPTAASGIRPRRNVFRSTTLAKSEAIMRPEAITEPGTAEV